MFLLIAFLLIKLKVQKRENRVLFTFLENHGEESVFVKCVIDGKLHKLNLKQLKKHRENLYKECRRVNETIDIRKLQTK